MNGKKEENRQLPFWRLIACLSTIALLQIVSVPTRAQVDKATVNGTVSDQSGAVVPGVHGTAANLQTGVKYQGTTNEVGIHQIRGLSIGHYSLQFEKTGFKKMDRPGLTLETGQLGEVDVKLLVGSPSEQVEVTAAPPVLLETETATMGTVMTGKALEDLPLDINGGRDIHKIENKYVHTGFPYPWYCEEAGWFMRVNNYMLGKRPL